MDPIIEGGCHCRAVRYACQSAPIAEGHCQCSDCRIFSGTGHSSHLMAARTAVRITGVAKGYSTRADSGNTVTRYFCATCGAQVYSLNSGYPDAIYLRASSLDDPSRFHPRMVVFTDSAPPWDFVDSALMRFPRMPQG